MARQTALPSIILCGLIALGSAAMAQPADEERATAGFLVQLGHKDAEPQKYDGTISLSAGDVVRLEEWRFDLEDKIVSKTEWQCSTRLERLKKLRPDQEAAMAAAGKKPPTPKPVVNGFFVYVNAPEGDSATINTAAGSFSFKLADVPLGTRLFLLDGRASVERVAVSRRLTGEPLHDDYGSIVVGKDGSVWVAYTAYNDEKEEDYVFVRQCRGGQWAEPVQLTEQGTDAFETAIAVDAAGRVWVVWSERPGKKGQNWDLFARAIENGKPAKLCRLTTEDGSDIYHEMIPDKNGRLVLVWQGFRGRHSDIFMKTCENGEWSPPVRISENPANDWEPCAAVDSAGKIYVAWDSYQNGNYDICLRTFANGELSPVRMITTSPLRESHVTLDVDKQDRLWLAWQESSRNWGKDQGFTMRPAYLGDKNAAPWGAGLLGPRAAVVACLEGDKLMSLGESPFGKQWFVVNNNNYPRVKVDSSGRLWLFVRRREIKQTGGNPKGIWHDYALYHDGKQWSKEIMIPNSNDRQDVRISVADAPEGGLLLAWACGERPYRDPQPMNNNVFTSSLKIEGESGGLPALVDYKSPEVKEIPTSHPNEPEDLKRIKEYRATVAGKTYRVLRGDTHRHTDLSADGAGDSSQYDMFRYAIDASGMDWISSGDHDAGWGVGQPYSWWRLQKAADLFFVDDYFEPLFGYERSNGWPHGHRNATSPDRGARFFERIYDEPPKQEQAEGKKRQRRRMRRLSDNDTKSFYEYLRKTNSICISHTSGTSTMGTDWRDNDPEVEPVVEIFQGCRTSFEYPKAPLAADPDNVATQEGGFDTRGYVWEAWKKGLRLGTIASSDHGSTHISFACVWAEEFSRENIFKSMKARHTYGATDNIILVFSVDDHLMGDEFATDKIPTINVKVIGTAELKAVELCKNNVFIHTLNPEGTQCEFTYKDEAIAPGQTSYYYLRVQQEDRQVAWSSPIWVNYKRRE